MHHCCVTLPGEVMVTGFKPSRDARVTRSLLPLSLRMSSFKSEESEVQSFFPNIK